MNNWVMIGCLCVVFGADFLVVSKKHDQKISHKHTHMSKLDILNTENKSDLKTITRDIYGQLVRTGEHTPASWMSPCPGTRPYRRRRPQAPDI